MNITITDEFPPLNNVQLEELERQISVILPAEYRSFLLSHNGGRPSPNLFLCKDGGGSLVDWFLGVHDGPYDNLKDYFKTFKVSRQAMPVNIVPVAHDPFGNLVCLSVSGADIGSVYFWDHEREQKRLSYNNLHLIANSFTTFLSGLHEKQSVEYEAELRRALLKNDLTGMAEAIAAGWDVNSPTGINALSALEFAAGNNQVEIAKLLLDNGAKIGNARDTVKRHADFLLQRDYTEMIKLLSA